MNCFHKNRCLKSKYDNIYMYIYIYIFFNFKISVLLTCMHFLLILIAVLRFLNHELCNDQVYMYTCMHTCHPTMEGLILSGSPSPQSSLGACLPTSTGVVYPMSTQEFPSISLPQCRVSWYSRRVSPLFLIIGYLYLSMQRS